MRIAGGNAPYIVSLRRSIDYANGHIPGAINVAFSNLAKLPKDKEILVYCYTGHSSAQATAVLQVLGYDAYSLKFGMCSWTSDMAVNMDKCYKAANVVGYDVEKR